MWVCMWYKNIPRLTIDKLKIIVEIEILLSTETNHEGNWTPQGKNLPGVFCLDGTFFTYSSIASSYPRKKIMPQSLMQKISKYRNSHQESLSFSLLWRLQKSKSKCFTKESKKRKKDLPKSSINWHSSSRTIKEN